MAILDTPVDLERGPIAIELPPVASAPLPNADASVALALAPLPTAVATTALALAKVPQAVAL